MKKPLFGLCTMLFHLLLIRHSITQQCWGQHLQCPDPVLWRENLPPSFNRQNSIPRVGTLENKMEYNNPLAGKSDVLWISGMLGEQYL